MFALALVQTVRGSAPDVYFQLSQKQLSLMPDIRQGLRLL
jgi:hypothetical protein